MEWLIFFGIGAVWYYLANNKEKNSSFIKVKTYQKTHTHDGYIEIETVQTQHIDNVDFKNKASGKAPHQPPHISVNSFKEYDQHPQVKDITPVSSPSHTKAIVNSGSRQVISDEVITQGYIPHMKLCNGCNKTLKLEKFSQHPTNPDGKTKWCTSCLSKSSKTKTSDNLKKCKKCGHMRRLKAFYPSDKSADGLSKWCITCHHEQDRARISHQR